MLTHDSSTYNGMTNIASNDARHQFSTNTWTRAEDTVHTTTTHETHAYGWRAPNCDCDCGMAAPPGLASPGLAPPCFSPSWAKILRTARDPTTVVEPIAAAAATLSILST